MKTTIEFKSVQAAHRARIWSAVDLIVTSGTGNLTATIPDAAIYIDPQEQTISLMDKDCGVVSDDFRFGEVVRVVFEP